MSSNRACINQRHEVTITHFPFVLRFAVCLMAALVLSFAGCSTTAKTEAVAAEQTYKERLQSCKEQIEAVTDFKPDVVLVLGTGLGDFADTLDVKAKIAYKDIDG